MDKIVMIVAGGSGTRMKTEVPKQFLLIHNQPVLMHTLKAFYLYDRNIRIILILPEIQLEYWERLCDQHHFGIRHDIRTGGVTRFHSVQKNLSDIPDEALVAIHDGVRPLVSIETISRCFNSAQKHGNAVPCVAIPETLRKTSKNGSRQVDRTQFRLIQTPQVYLGRILKEAYTQQYNKYFTDDAGVVEKAGNTIHLVEGNAENIKITFEKDLAIASSLLSAAK